MALALPKSFRRALAPLYGNPAAVTLYYAAIAELAWRKWIQDAQARPAQSGADHASLAQPVPYHALHGETGEGFETRASRYDLI